MPSPISPKGARRPHPAWCLLGAFCLLSAVPQDACADDGANLLSLNLQELTTIKIDTVFGASKFTQKLSDAPSSVSIVTRDEIKRFGYRTLGEIVQSVRSFDVTYDRNYSYTGVRGFNGLGDYGARVLLLIDGHRTNDLIYDSSAVGTAALIDVDLIERVEFIRGPGSAIYGSNAFFAVINVVTRTGGDVGGAEVSGSAGSFDTYSGRFTFGRKFANGVQLLLSGTDYQSAGPSRLYFKEFDARETNHGIADHHDADQFWSLYGALSWGDFTLASGYSDRTKEVPTGAFGAAFNAAASTQDTRGFAELRYAHETGDGWQLAGRLFYDAFDYNSPVDYAGDDDRLVLNNDYARARWWGGEASLGRTFFDRFRFTMGVEVRSTSKLELGNYDVSPFLSYQKANADESVTGLYAQSDTEILKNLRLSAGLRWDHYNTFGEAVNPRLGLIYNPWRKTTLKLLYGTAFRAPNIYEAELASPTFKPALDLNPEKISTYEFVAEQNLSSHWRAMASVFYNDISDLIDSQLDPADGLITFRNLNNVRMHGAELEIEGKWDNGTLLRASYARQEVENTQTRRRLENSPENVLKAQLSVPVWRDRLFGSIELLYASDRTTLRRARTGDTWLVNATLFSRELLPRLECSASIYNLLGEKYHFVGGPEHVQDQLEQDGRTFRLKLTYTF
ncbi:MAG: outer rane receptor for ferrienterochelin and colicin [Chthoniobacter sp.]|jgi:iron complex outermembrane receptor protein|nr:outer rane receptor for ferrienterochelin and colicin [Chthoniobacter sp.]